MIFTIIISAMVSFVVSLLMMKFQMSMITKWMDNFFEEETKRINKFLMHDK